KGFEVCWFPGTDHAGIATEARVVKYLKQTENVSRDELGREEFIKRVWQWKDEFGGKIIKQLRTLGCSCDWERERFTMDEGLSDAVKKVFVELYNKGYIYRGQRMINWCPAAKSALSDEEVIYKDVPGKFYYFRYPVENSGEYVVVATTRPETMFGDTAVAVHPDDERYKHLIGKMLCLPLTDRKIPVIADIHADPTKGTGCVKITPAHDPNDFEVGRRNNLEVINIMNPDATLNSLCGPEFAGMERFAAREKCVAMLSEQGLVEKIEDIVHAVGYSERGDVPIETLVSFQWFCRMGELAKPAIEAVRSGEIKFYPERWSKTYFHWMENIQDWCISRQLWWGHRIPAWYNDDTNEVYVGLEAPTAPGNWRQEEDVLDTWFSSWLWPFSIMGWPEKTPELDYFYTTNDLVTGPDIIFFWVARMIMAGCEFMGKIPFKNVYFTSIIRDDKGRKLSKSLGNSPDPLDVIAEYGADALRFSIVYIAPVGMDIRYSNEKCEIGRNFANKLWNACRFRQMQGPSKVVDTLPENLSADEKWMASKLDAAAAFIDAELEKFRFHTAAHALYDLVWSDFCDWFVEAEKLPMRAGGADKERALAVLDWALFRILKLLHPFMPFVTEELAHRMGLLAENELLMYQPLPLGENLTFDDEAKWAEAKFELVKGGRFLRSSYNIPDGRKLKFHVKAADNAALEGLKGQFDSLKLLLNAEDIELTLESFDSEKQGAAPSKLCQAGIISLPLTGLIDVDAERAKLQKELADINKWIAGTAGKLKNERFVANAPEQVVANARAQLAELEDRKNRTEELLAALK
ncbi:MAG: valine--tRNA ligase, partial [Lentisphaeria bacterium]|nr:valine--tRNA ligase [Lentisphaeria bacterium]